MRLAGVRSPVHLSRPAVILSPFAAPPADVPLVDSKLLTAQQREIAEAWIRVHATAVEVEAIGVEPINRLGIGWANRMIFGRLMTRLGRGRYIVDGNLHLHGLGPMGTQVLCVCDGDVHVPAIAACLDCRQGVPRLVGWERYMMPTLAMGGCGTRGMAHVSISKRSGTLAVRIASNPILTTCV